MNESQISEASKGESQTQAANQIENQKIKQENEKESDLPIIERARQVSEQMQRVNAETKLLLDRREKMLAEEMIQGRALAGLVKSPELTPEEYSNKVLEGKINPLKIE